MSESLRAGLERVDVYKVEKAHSASHVGSGSVKVLSTPSMIAFMERTAMLCVQDYLPEGYTTVGTKVCVEHVAPAPVGAEVTVRAKLVEVQGRRLVFEVEAKLDERVIGRGTHERFIVNVEKFLKKVSQLSEERHG